VALLASFFCHPKLAPAPPDVLARAQTRPGFGDWGSEMTLESQFQFSTHWMGGASCRWRMGAENLWLVADDRSNEGFHSISGADLEVFREALWRTPRKLMPPQPEPADPTEESIFHLHIGGRQALAVTLLSFNWSRVAYGEFRKAPMWWRIQMNQESWETDSPQVQSAISHFLSPKPGRHYLGLVL